MGSISNPQANSPQRYRFGIYEADLRAGELTRDGRKVKLQEQPFQVLTFLLERAGDVVTREELQQRLWPADTFVDFDHSLNTAINKLRDALRDTAENPRFIETKPRRGYRFIAPVQAIDDPQQQSTVAIPAISEATTQTPSVVAERTAFDTELPNAHRGLTRTLLTLIQVMYLSFYIAALARLGEVGRISDRFFDGREWVLVVAVLITAVLAIPIRLYLLSAFAFDYAKTGTKFLRLFPFVLILDLLWALAPFLLTDHIGIGLAFAATAALLYLPFSQRTLVRMTYPQS